LKMPNDQSIAFRFLETKASGFSLGLFYRRLLPQYSMLLVCFFLFVLLSLVLVLGSLLVAFAIGTSAGVLMRDLHWFRASRTTWKFNEKAIDWDKVQRIAEGDFV
jgi:hypothetical protein